MSRNRMKPMATSITRTVLSMLLFGGIGTAAFGQSLPAGFVDELASGV